ncbi:MAG TPA: pyruvate kinase [Verrucomicrobiales bacterium]|nr:pyruvate kinase [Verrucomicrobiales bacterium]
MLRKTKIIATLGPATESPEIIDALIRGGVNLFRLNMSHAPPEWCREVTARARKAAEAAGLDVAILMDMRGPTIRTGDLSPSVQLNKGDTVEFTLNDAPASHPISTSVNYPGLYLDLKKGDTVLVDNGILQMTVLETSPERVICCVVTEGKLGSRRHINLPGIRVNLPALTQKDFDDVLLAVETGCDWVAMSFVRDASHIHQLRRELRAKGCHAHIMAKIEDQQAVAHLDEIIEASDAVMVARGDLGIEVHMEELPVIQRRIVNRCIIRGKPVVVATHMLESMITNPVPTRAEVTDVANAVFEEADAIMLSGETSSGAYPIRCVEAMAKIALRAEAADCTPSMARHSAITNDKQRLVKAAVDLADSIEGASIIVFTQRGVLAGYAAWFRPQRAHIFAFCPDLTIARALHLSRALCPFQLAFDPKNRRESIERAVEVLKRKRLIREGTSLVIISDVLETESAMDSIVVQKA